MQTVFVKASQGQDASFAGKRLIIKAHGKDTGGAFSLMDYILPPHGSGHGFHYHAHFEKSLYILSGRLIVQVEDTIYDTGPGDFICIPRGAAHDFYNPDDRPLHLLMHFSPTGFEDLFVEMAQVEREGKKDKARIDEIRARYDVIDLPVDWLKELKAKRPDLF